MMLLLWIIIATLIDTLLALVGIVVLFKRDIKNIVFFLVALSAGTLLGGSFFHLISESLENIAKNLVFDLVLLGFVLFFVLERYLYWHHCHEGKCKVHPYTKLILLGDGIHNFIDGLIIAASFIVSIPFGVVTSLLIFSHEIPQELGDFGALVHGGMKPKRALIFNLVSQATCLVGGIIGYLFTNATPYAKYLLPFAAGGFIYIAASDLIPELHKQIDRKQSFVAFTGFILGLMLLYVMKLLI